MSNTFLPSTLSKACLSLVVLLAVVGCDGGLFGTGDGSDIVEPVGGSAPVTDVQPEAPVVGSPNSPADPSAGADNASATNDRLENLLASSNNPLAIVSLINSSSQVLNIVGTDAATPLHNTAIEIGAVSEQIQISEDLSMLSIVSQQETEILFSYSSIDLAPSSVTTLIAFDIPQPAANTQIVPSLGVIALRTLTISPDPTVASVRIVQASQLGDSDDIATLTLEPSGLNPGSGEVAFDSISLNNAPLSTYMPVNEGMYRLRDSRDRFEPIPVSFSAGRIYTLVVSGFTIPSLIIAIDSDVNIQSDAN